MEKNPTWTCVVAAALNDGAGRWLMHRRPAHKEHGGLWEFPGGKVEPGENPREALVREIREELGLELEPDKLRAAAMADETVAKGRPPIVILLYTCPWPGGTMIFPEGGVAQWFAAEEVARLAKPPLDRSLASSLFENLAV